MCLLCISTCCIISYFNSRQKSSDDESCNLSLNEILNYILNAHLLQNDSIVNYRIVIQHLKCFEIYLKTQQKEEYVHFLLMLYHYKVDQNYEQDAKLIYTLFLDHDSNKQLNIDENTRLYFKSLIYNNPDSLNASSFDSLIELVSTSLHESYYHYVKSEIYVQFKNQLK